MVCFLLGDRGRGLSIQAIDDERLIAYCYTFDPVGKPIWIFASGRVAEPEEGSTRALVNFEASLIQGGVFGPGFDPDSVSLGPWGEFDIEFSTCGVAAHSWRPILDGWTDGSDVIEQLAGNVAVDCDARHKSLISQ